PRHHHDVEAGWGWVQSKEFPDEPLGAVPLDGGPELSGGRDAEPREAARLRQRENGHRPAVELATGVVDGLEVAALPDVRGGPEPVLHLRPDPTRSTRSTGPLPLRRDRQALAALGPATLQNGLAVLGPHPDEEPVRPAAPAIVRLKCTL